MNPKALLLSLAFHRWTPPGPNTDGYTILLPSPMDIPFMLRLGLEGLQHINTEDCRQILVVPDGWGNDHGAGLERIVEEFDDPRLEVVKLRAWDYFWIRRMRPPGCAATHWMLVVNGTRLARCNYAFLHDADAFFLERDGLQRQYMEARDRRMHTLGVTPRWDDFFVKNGFTIPGTWELMYSTRWARSRSPYALKGRRLRTPHGVHEFDSMHYAQYMDHASGRVGVMASPPKFVHFNGTIFTYRLFRDADGRPVTDELFRLLLLSVIETALSVADEKRALPTAEELARGLTDPKARVLYQSETNRQGYAEFRHLFNRMCQAPVFQGQRAVCMTRLLEPFDLHFEYDPASSYQAALQFGEMRTTGLKQSSP